MLNVECFRPPDISTLTTGAAVASWWRYVASPRMKIPEPLTLLVVLTLSHLHVFAAEIPTEWIDPDTGHRVVRISPEPDSASLYFHQNTYTPKGDKMIFDGDRGIEVVDLNTLASGHPHVELVVSNAGALAMSWKTPEVYYRWQGALCAADVNTRAVREVFRGRVQAINCDESFVVNTVYAE